MCELCGTSNLEGQDVEVQGRHEGGAAGGQERAEARLAEAPRRRLSCLRGQASERVRWAAQIPYSYQWSKPRVFDSIAPSPDYSQAHASTWLGVTPSLP